MVKVTEPATRSRRWRWPARSWVPVAVIGAVVAGAVALAARSAPDASTTSRLRTGTAWFVAPDGAATLVDGQSGNRLASVGAATAPITRPLSVEQTATGAFVVNEGDGTIVRLSSRTLAAPTKAYAFGKPGTGLRILATDRSGFVASEADGTISVVDTANDLVRGDRIAFDGDIASLDLGADGALWGLDADHTHVVRIGRDHRLSAVALPLGTHARVLLGPNGAPAVVDTDAGQLLRLDPARGTVRSRQCLRVAAQGELQLAAAADRDQVMALDGDRALMVVADASVGGCAEGISLDDEIAHHRYGPPVGLHGDVFVPDQTTGQIVIVHPRETPGQRTERVASTVEAGRSLRLFTHDGRVWYQAVDSDHVGSLDARHAAVGSLRTDQNGPAVLGDNISKVDPPTATAPPTTVGDRGQPVSSPSPNPSSLATAATATRPPPIRSTPIVPGTGPPPRPPTPPGQPSGPTTKPTTATTTTTASTQTTVAPCTPSKPSIASSKAGYGTYTLTIATPAGACNDHIEITATPPIPGEPVRGGPNGATTVTGLVPCTTYAFAVQTASSTGMLSPPATLSGRPAGTPAKPVVSARILSQQGAVDLMEATWRMGADYHCSTGFDAAVHGGGSSKIVGFAPGSTGTFQFVVPVGSTADVYVELWYSIAVPPAPVDPGTQRTMLSDTFQITAQPDMASAVQINLATTDDDKDFDSVLTVTITASDGAVIGLYNQGAASLLLPNNSSRVLGLSPGRSTVTALQSATLKICIAPNGNDTWRFNWTVSAARSFGGTFAKSGGLEQLTQDSRCLSRPLA